MGYNLFISHKACSLVLDRLSRKVFVCTNFVIIGVKLQSQRFLDRDMSVLGYN